MKYKLLGERTGLRVSELALGMARISRESTEEEALRVLEHFAEAGGNFIDTSSFYNFGRSEEMIGKFLATANRENFVISSKYGLTAAHDPMPASVGNHRKAIKAEVEGSLKRLKTDRIDLYFAHFDDGITPIGEIMRGFDELIREGKIIYAGLSNFPAWQVAAASYLAEFRGWESVAALQLQHNLLERAADREHVPLARARGLGVMAWSPLAGGILTGKGRLTENNKSTKSSKALIKDDGRTDKVVDVILEIAAQIGCEAASVSIAWLNTKNMFPIIGPKTSEQLKGNLAAVNIELSEKQIKRLEEASKIALGHPYEMLIQERERLGIYDKTPE